MIGHPPAGEIERHKCYVGTEFATMEATVCDFGVLNCKTVVKKGKTDRLYLMQKKMN